MHTYDIMPEGHHEYANLGCLCWHSNARCCSRVLCRYCRYFYSNDGTHFPDKYQYIGHKPKTALTSVDGLQIVANGITVTEAVTGIDIINEVVGDWRPRSEDTGELLIPKPADALDVSHTIDFTAEEHLSAHAGWNLQLLPMTLGVDGSVAVYEERYTTTAVSAGGRGETQVRRKLIDGDLTEPLSQGIATQPRYLGKKFGMCGDALWSVVPDITGEYFQVQEYGDRTQVRFDSSSNPSLKDARVKKVACLDYATFMTLDPFGRGKEPYGQGIGPYGIRVNENPTDPDLIANEGFFDLSGDDVFAIRMTEESSSLVQGTILGDYSPLFSLDEGVPGALAASETHLAVALTVRSSERHAAVVPSNVLVI